MSQTRLEATSTRLICKASMFTTEWYINECPLNKHGLCSPAGPPVLHSSQASLLCVLCSFPCLFQHSRNASIYNENVRQLAEANSICWGHHNSPLSCKPANLSCRSNNRSSSIARLNCLRNQLHASRKQFDLPLHPVLKILWSLQN